RGTLYGPGPGCEQVIVRPDGSNPGAEPISLTDVSYVTVDGIISDGSNTALTTIGVGALRGDHVTFTNIQIQNSGCHGFGTGGGTVIDLRHSKVIGPGRGTEAAGTGCKPNGAHGLYFASSDSVIDSNEIAGWVNNFGIHGYSQTSGLAFSNSIISNN